MKRRGLLVAAVVALALAAILANAIASSYALARIGAQPFVILDRAGNRLAVRPPPGAGPPPAGPSVTVHATRAIWFGYGQDYRLADGSRITCNFRWTWARCSGGWRLEPAALGIDPATPSPTSGN